MVENVCTMSDKRSAAAKPVEEGLMEKYEMLKYIEDKLKEADYTKIELVYGLVIGLFSK